MLTLRLYIAGSAPSSVQAIANTQAVCAEHFADRHELEIIDVLLHKRRALDDGIIVTPTLLRLTPLPVKRVVGNLSDVVLLLSALGQG